MSFPDFGDYQTGLQFYLFLEEQPVIGLANYVTFH